MSPGPEPQAPDPIHFLSAHWREVFGQRVQKLVVHSPHRCRYKNKTGGCSYCNSLSFIPPRAMGVSLDDSNSGNHLETQLMTQAKEFELRYPDQPWLLYFQSLEQDQWQSQAFRGAVDRLLSYRRSMGIVVALRPDQVDQDLVQWLEELSRRCAVAVEVGMEHSCDLILAEMARGYDHGMTSRAIARLKSVAFPWTKEKPTGLVIGAHIIVGWPGETRANRRELAQALSKLSVDYVKIHHLQVLRGSPLALRWDQGRLTLGDLPFASLEAYVAELVDFFEHLSPSIVVDRVANDAPLDQVLAPLWHKKGYEIRHLLEKRLKDQGSFQGRALIPGGSE